MRKIVGDVAWLLYIGLLMLWLFAVLCWHEIRIALTRAAVKADTSY